jgi:hypothetical protein
MNNIQKASAYLAVSGVEVINTGRSILIFIGDDNALCISLTDNQISDLAGRYDKAFS